MPSSLHPNNHTYGCWTPHSRASDAHHQSSCFVVNWLHRRATKQIPNYIACSRGEQQSDAPRIRVVKPRSHCADHTLPMFPIIADRPDLSWSWQNHQIVILTPDLCLSKTVSTILVRQMYDTGTTEVFDPLLVRFPRPLIRPLIRLTRLRSRCWRPHSRPCRFATAIKTT